jgi:hypothetical protein
MRFKRNNEWIMFRLVGTELSPTLGLSHPKSTATKLFLRETIDSFNNQLDIPHYIPYI